MSRLVTQIVGLNDNVERHFFQRCGRKHNWPFENHRWKRKERKHWTIKRKHVHCSRAWSRDVDPREFASEFSVFFWRNVTNYRVEILTIIPPRSREITGLRFTRERERERERERDRSTSLVQLVRASQRSRVSGERYAGSCCGNSRREISLKRT